MLELGTAQTPLCFLTARPNAYELDPHMADLPRLQVFWIPCVTDLRRALGISALKTSDIRPLLKRPRARRGAPKAKVPLRPDELVPARGPRSSARTFLAGACWCA